MVRFVFNLWVYVYYGGVWLYGEVLCDYFECIDLVVSIYIIVICDIDELLEYEWNWVVLDEV